MFQGYHNGLRLTNKVAPNRVFNNFLVYGAIDLLYVRIQSMKMVYVFLLGIFSLKMACMEKPTPPSAPTHQSAFVRVKAAAAAWPPLPLKSGATEKLVTQKPAAAWLPKPAAAGLMAKKSAAASLKRSSDEEEETKTIRRRRHKSIDLGSSADSFMEEVKKMVVKTVVLTLAQETKKEIEEGRLKLISVDPPLCEVMVQVPWRCRYGCRQEFINKDVERQHIMDSHKVVPASADQEWGIDWEEINKMENYIRQTTPPLPEEDQEEEGVEEIVI